MNAAVGRACRPGRGLGWQVALPLGLAAFALLPARAATLDCAPLPVSVTAPQAEDAREVCAAAKPVIEFFRELGVEVTEPVPVQVLSGLPPEFGAAMLGCFTPDSRQVRMLTFDAARQRGTWFGRAVDRSLYRSLAAHELAHALAWCQAPQRPLSVRAREYVAYVVMFATMEAALREAILAQMPGTADGVDGRGGDALLSDLHFYLAPSQFGVDAYRHYLRPENGPRFLREVLRGAALPARDD